MSEQDNKGGKKIVRLAVIRSNTDKMCPFGLVVPDACSCAGKLVDQMQPVLRVDPDGFDTLLIKEKKSLLQVVRSNMSVLSWSEDEPCHCKYANAVMDEKHKVECNFGDQAAGLGHADWTGFPSYTQYFAGGYSSVPIGFYSEHPVRNQIGNLEALVSGSFAKDESDDGKINKKS
jgi:hypothetical protein